MIQAAGEVQQYLASGADLFTIVIGFMLLRHDRRLALLELHTGINKA